MTDQTPTDPTSPSAEEVAEGRRVWQAVVDGPRAEWPTRDREAAVERRIRLEAWVNWLRRNAQPLLAAAEAQATLSEALEHGQVVVDAGGIRGVLEEGPGLYDIPLYRITPLPEDPHA